MTVGYTGDGSPTNRPFSIDSDVQALGLKLAEFGDVAAVVIDPITVYLGGTDSHKNAEVRGLLAPLSELAARHNTAIICVSHLTKATATNPLMRVIGSLAFVAAARAAYLVTVDPQDKTRRLFLPMKNNLGPDTSGLAFHIEGASVASAAGPLATSRIAWDPEPVSMSADEAMEVEKPPSTSALDTAVDWLQETLSDGPVPSGDVLKQARAASITQATLRRAASKLEIQKTKSGMNDGWAWSLPAKMLKSSEGAQEETLSAFGGLEHLRPAVEEIEI